MKKYRPEKIEKKWQKKWEESKIFQAADKSRRKKFYFLVEFPYPSGEGLHVGHCRSYIGLDILARKRRMEGFNVLFPIGWDAFGLPTENYAVKTGIHPIAATRKNTANFRRQSKKIGLSFDWSREINTTNPEYYKWTQWIFLQLFKKDLAYKAKMPVNWCPSCKIGLANEEVVEGKCERCGGQVVKKEKEQWMLKITKYAERLIKDLNRVDYPEKVKISQKEWIGRSEGWEIKFSLFFSGSSEKGRELENSVSVFTTRPDTLFGCTYLVLAPEHALIEKIKSRIKNYRQVKKYIEDSKNKIEKQRTAKEKGKTGIILRGVEAVNPANNRKIPIFIADYVLMNYGSGAIMAVPAHDQRDWDFAKLYNLSIIDVIVPQKVAEVRPHPFRVPADFRGGAYEGSGILINSGRFTGMKSGEAGERIGKWLFGQGVAERAVYYKLRDWVFSRQRYWGEPIPMVWCQKCGWQSLSEKDLPLKLPRVKEYKPTEKGESPLAKAEKWVRAKCPKCGGRAKRETDVMPNWAGSNWYYLRYCDPGNSEKLADFKKLKYWLGSNCRTGFPVRQLGGGVDWYNGGMEHTTLHLLYSRFIYKFLWDFGFVPKSIGPEPYKKRTSHGMVLAEKGKKMSKSKGNVVNPEEIIDNWGADTLRIYEMFMGPFEQAIPWDTKGVKGAKRFLDKVWKLQCKTVREGKIQEPKLESLINKTTRKVSDDIESLKFNTAVSSLMILANELGKQKEISLNHFSRFLIILSPFAPHISEELWQRFGFSGFCCQKKWIKRDLKKIKEDTINLIVQINGKVRAKIEVSADIPEKEAKETALSEKRVLKWTKSREIKKTIFIPGKLINFVVDKK